MVTFKNTQAPLCTSLMFLKIPVCLIVLNSIIDALAFWSLFLFLYLTVIEIVNI